MNKLSHNQRELTYEPVCDEVDILAEVVQFVALKGFATQTENAPFWYEPGLHTRHSVAAKVGKKNEDKSIVPIEAL